MSIGDASEVYVFSICLFMNRPTLSVVKLDLQFMNSRELAQATATGSRLCHACPKKVSTARRVFSFRACHMNRCSCRN